MVINLLYFLDILIINFFLNLTNQEPTAGIDPEARRKIWKMLMYIRKVNNVSILLTSHSMEECEALSSRLAIMINGKQYKKKFNTI